MCILKQYKSVENKKYAPVGLENDAFSSANRSNIDERP